MSYMLKSSTVKKCFTVCHCGKYIEQIVSNVISIVVMFSVFQNDTFSIMLPEACCMS